MSDVHTMNNERALDLQTLLSSAEYGTARDFFRNDPYWQKSITGHEGVALLYELVRLMRPSIVVEIGTFEGRTAQAIAKALLRNASGIIHTVGPFDRERFRLCSNAGPRTSSALRAITNSALWIST